MEKDKKDNNYESVLLERLESKIDILVEGQKIMGKRVGSIETEVGSIKTKVDLLVEDMDFVKGEVVEIKNRFKEVDAQLDKKTDKEVARDHETRIISLENTALAKA